jgi:hypothetical protein
LEKNIKSLAPKEVDKGEEYYNNIKNFADKSANLIESGTKLYNGIAKIYNATSSGKESPLPIVNTGDGNKSEKKVKVKTAKKSTDDSSDKKTNKSDKKEDKKDESNDKSESSDEKVYTGEVFGEGASKGSQSRKYAKAKKKVDDTIFDMTEPSNLPVVYTDRGRSYIYDEYF